VFIKGAGQPGVQSEWVGTTWFRLRGGLEHLKIETRLINEMFASVMGECVILTPQGLLSFKSPNCLLRIEKSRS